MDRDFFSTSVSWGAVFAGSVVACAVTMMVSAFGVGGGLSLVSPWAGEGVSATTFHWLGGFGLVCLAVIASTFGGYITGRLRPAWDDVHPDDRYFRDTAHGFVTWALATVLTASVFAAAGTHILAGAAAGSIPAAGAAAGQAASQGDVYADHLLRSTNTPSGGAQADPRAELVRLIAPATRPGGQVSQDDRAYAAQLVAARTGISPEEAQRRVDQTVAQAKDTADKARRAAMKAALWAAIALLAGALASALAAAEGGKMRNSRWYEISTTTTTRRT